MSPANGKMVQQHDTMLPCLPVPPLEQTLKRFLRSVKPFVTDEEFRVTQNLAKIFATPGGIGEKLQKMLEEKASNTENWLADWWINLRYLAFRLPLVVHYNPGLVFPLRHFASISDQLLHATTLILAALDFKKEIEENTFPREYLESHPLDMSQYQRFFGTHRIPAVSMDVLLLPDPTQPTDKNIIVAHNNHFFAVSVYGEQGEPLNQQQLLAQLLDVLALSTSSLLPAGAPVGLLTTDYRDTWAKTYETLSKDRQNRVNLDMIERSLFLLCLDGETSQAEKSSFNRDTAAALKFIHGGGSKSNSANRWFDKTVQFIVGKDGEVGLTYEHSPSDGQPIARMMDYIEAYCERHGSANVHLPAAKTYEKPQHLMFKLTKEIENVINIAEKNLNNLVDDFEMHSFSFTDYGKDFLKCQKVSPDSFIQMAIQCTFYRIHQEPGAHYESATTRRFIHGRTETIRSCSTESVHLAKTMLDPTASVTLKASTLRAAIKSHKDYVDQAHAGQGVDRHLMGLHQLAIENGLKIPELFLDAGYTRSDNMRLSSSQVAGKCHSFMCYGPHHSDGYGCCYNPRDHEIVFGVSAFNSDPNTTALQFCLTLEKLLCEMKQILLRSPSSAKL